MRVTSTQIERGTLTPLHKHTGSTLLVGAVFLERVGSTRRTVAGRAESHLKRKRKMKKKGREKKRREHSKHPLLDRRRLGRVQATPGTMLHCTAVHGTYTHTHTLPACMHDGVIHVTHSGVGMSAGYSLAQPAHARMLPLMPLLDFLGFLHHHSMAKVWNPARVQWWVS